MAETLVEEEITEKDIYGITPKVREKYRRRLEQMIKDRGIKVAHTAEELYRHSDKSGQTPEEIRVEVDEFLQMREDDRKLSRERGR